MAGRRAERISKVAEQRGQKETAMARARISPGQLYKEIAVSKPEFESREEREELVRRREVGYVRFCKSAYKRFPSFGKGAKFKEHYKEAIDFLGWDLKAEEFSAAIKEAMFLSLLLGIIAVMGIFFFFSRELSAFLGEMFLFYLVVPVVLVAVIATYYVQNYPLNAAKVEEMRALTYIPEIIGYMTMSMKLSPNLEKAVEFAAEHGRGKVADDFKKILWDVQLGIYLTVSEALDELAYKWGKFSDEFKQGLMMIRASVLEDTEAKRYALLDKTMVSILDSVKEKMESYARALSQPSIVLFYIGILLPLILIIILPVGSSFSGASMARPEIMFALYNVAIPLMAFAFARNLIKSRPPTYEAPKIPDNFIGLPKKGRMRLGKKGAISIFAVVALVFIIGISASYFMHLYGAPPILEADGTAEKVLERDNKPANWFAPGGGKETELLRSGVSAGKLSEALRAEEQKYFMRPENDVTPYNLIFGLLITISICIALNYYYSNIYKRRIQQRIMDMESEFKDSLYIIASRMGENKPVEEAFKHAKEFLPNYKISQEVFGRIVDNINLLGMPLDGAIFDSNYGALKDNPSAIIRSSMRLLVDSVGLGVNVAARTMMSLSMQLQNSEKVTKMLSLLVKDITTMMRTMSVYIAPVVLGITTSLQKVVILTLSAISVESPSFAAGSLPASIPGLSGFQGFTTQGLGLVMKPEAFAQMANPAQFVFIVALYVIELVFIMSYFTTRIEEDNPILAKINLAKALPIAMIVFVVSVIGANLVVGGILV
ncbi:MAG: type II secretion system F family protein [Candidatus Diapherotrites archaeon]|uniref:Type II secretion system F family protein n=1 Tax=Candidatus Iainarchaeum sp. TaxID=3101447 RepID=A0A8T4KPX3_9ARCH|nr:type II secretion system F family protein [Candidatus Diapherotrites archaeon]